MKLYYSKYLAVFNFTSDLLLLNFSLFEAFRYANLSLNNLTLKLLVLIVNLTWLLIAGQFKNYKLKNQLEPEKVILKLLGTTLCQALALGSILYILNIEKNIYPVVFCEFLFIQLVLLQRFLLFIAVNYARVNKHMLCGICIIGDDNNAVNQIDLFYNRVGHDYKIVEFISNEELDNISVHALVMSLKQKKVKEIIITSKKIDTNYINSLIEECSFYSIQLKLFSNTLSEMSNAEIDNFQDIPLLSLNVKHKTGLSKIQLIKRTFDVVFSVVLMTTGSPVFILLAIITKLTSKGPVFYKQLRIGKHSKPFYIYKFRSMYVDSEKNGPQLASEYDPRVTSWGRLMRKTRLDELPQFWNVIKGDMSIVGPRPERQHFIDQIVERAPNYRKLSRIKPGITSVGQVQYGYAENIEEMCMRMEYDLQYLGKMNLNRDINIIMNTVKVMIQGRGK